MALRREGVVDPKDEAYRDHEARPLADHVSDFQAALVAKGDTKNHHLVTISRITRILTLAKFKRISDLSLSRTMEAIQSLREEGFNQQTVNHYIRAIKGFSRWLWKDGRTREHALAHLATKNPEADRRRVRRPLTPEECVKLVEATMAGPVVLGMTGPNRVMLYAIAAGTGLRRNELRTLTPERFDLVANSPTVTVRAWVREESTGSRAAFAPRAGRSACPLDRFQAPWKTRVRGDDQTDGRHAGDRPEGRWDRARDRFRRG